MRTEILFLSVLTLVIFGCNNQPEKNKINTVNSVEFTTNDSSKAIEFNKFKHNLPNSDFYYDIEISKIEFINIKDAFQRTEGQYSVPKLIDGIKLYVIYKMTNPYDKEMLVPIPDYYYITSSIFNAETKNTTFHRGCQCYIDNSATLTYKDKELYDIYEQKIDNHYCLIFKPNETKEFKVLFNDPKPFDTPDFTFVGFDENNGGTVNAVEIGVQINTKSKKIISQTRFK